MSEIKIAASTGEIDKRTINGNNGVRRGKDRKRRAPVSGYLVLKEEVRAGLKARLDEVVNAYGGCAALAREIGVNLKTVWGGKSEA
ncbi:transcriptional regulator [Salmonella phage 36]|uniref:Integrase n=1 Tax=Salmonella phage 36 TaxID=1654889 RepID=A0A0N7CA71_9CAUD|nr:transcriptional regulator [Salmonella phage 36]AKJ74038.1 integrase [Salmonella phage 36]